MSIPKDIAAVSTEWLSGAIGAEVKAFQVEQIGQGVGIMGDIYRVDLDSDDECPASVVVKLPSSFPENREQGVALGMFEAEVKFYRELAEEARVGLPHIYLADIEHGTAEFVIVMEDLCDLTMADQLQGMTLEQATAAVRVLAAIHAVWWGRAQTEALEWIPTMIGPRIQFVDQLLTDLLPPFLAGFGPALPAGGETLYERFAGNYHSINSVVAERSPWTIAHQDFRVENMLFGSDRVVVIDWQGIGRGPGAYDLAYLLGGSMDTDLRRATESGLLDEYHSALNAAGVTDYSRAALAEDYAHCHLMGGLATSMVTGGGMDLSNERGKALITTMAVRHAAAALDHDGLDRLAAITGSD